MPCHAMSMCSVCASKCLVLFLLLVFFAARRHGDFLQGGIVFCQYFVYFVGWWVLLCETPVFASCRVSRSWLKFYFSLDKPELDSHVVKCMIGQCTVVSVVCKRRCCSMIMNTIHCLRHRVQRGIWQVTSRGKLDRDPSSARENPTRLEQSLVWQELLHWIVESLLHQKLSKCIIVIIRILYHIIICYCHFQPPGSIGGFLLRFCLWQID